MVVQVLALQRAVSCRRGAGRLQELLHSVEQPGDGHGLAQRACSTDDTTCYSDSNHTLEVTSLQSVMMLTDGTTCYSDLNHTLEVTSLQSVMMLTDGTTCYSDLNHTIEVTISILGQSFSTRPLSLARPISLSLTPHRPSLLYKAVMMLTRGILHCVSHDTFFVLLNLINLLPPPRQKKRTSLARVGGTGTSTKRCFQTWHALLKNCTRTDPSLVTRSRSP